MKTAPLAPFTLIFPIEKLFMAAPLHRDRQNQRKYKWGSVSFWDGKWGPRGSVHCEDPWLLGTGSGPHPSQLDELVSEQLGALRDILRVTLLLPRPEHHAVLWEDSAGCSAGEEMPHGHCALLVTECLCPGMRSPRLCQALSPEITMRPLCGSDVLIYCMKITYLEQCICVFNTHLLSTCGTCP